ncbi:chromodomain-helicase-DNA-binding protein 7 [Lates japonicus]|uniref:Chromodomain-helicase-DNA-binding protein 7 n=1 Tax=Lates japonicus TaxID=270547 RepID=A0AAD3MWM5_LATJO|nr:chromodomain-helicase-DNA-binding protein 7 [Lates japonicus]
MNGMASHHHNPANLATHTMGKWVRLGGGGGGVESASSSRADQAYQQPPTHWGAPIRWGGTLRCLKAPRWRPTHTHSSHEPTLPSTEHGASAQDPSHYLGHVGMGGTRLDTPSSQPQPQAGSNMSHPDTHTPPPLPTVPTHPPASAGRTGGCSTGYQAQYGVTDLGLDANTNASTNTPPAMAPGRPARGLTRIRLITGQQGWKAIPLHHTQLPALQTHSAPMQQQAWPQPMHP